MCQGQALGPSGWIGEMLLPLLNCPDAMDLLAGFITDFRYGTLADELKPYLLAANLIPFAKPNSKKTRPVVVGEVFYRLATGYAVTPIQSTIADILAPIQLGICVRGGVETAHHYINGLASDPALGLVAITVDMSNAFNVKERYKLLDALYK